MNDPSASYTVTLRDVAHDLGAKLDKNTDAIHSVELTLATIQSVKVQSDDHEARIRVIEGALSRYRYVFGGVGTLAGGVSGWLANVLTHVHH